MYTILSIDPGVTNCASCIMTWSPGETPVIIHWSLDNISSAPHTTDVFHRDIDRYITELVALHPITHVGIEQQPNMAKKMKVIAGNLFSSIISRIAPEVNVSYVSAIKFRGFKGTYNDRKKHAIKVVLPLLKAHNLDNGSKQDDLADAYMIAIGKAKLIMKKIPVGELKLLMQDHMPPGKYKRAELEEAALLNLWLGLEDS